MGIKYVLLAVFAFKFVFAGTNSMISFSNSFFILSGQLCGLGKHIPGCSSGVYTTNLPMAGQTWQIDIDTTIGKVLWWDINGSINKGRQATISDFSNMYHIVMVFGGGIFDVNVNNNFLKTRYNDLHVTYPTSTRVNVANGATTRIIGEKITTTSVTSYQLTFTSYGSNICFGLISASDVNAVTLDGGDFTTHWGVCTGNTYPVGQLAIVCPCVNCAVGCATCFGAGSYDCTACAPGYYFDSYCKSCHVSCSVCTSSFQNACSECSSGYFLWPSSTTCSSSCPTGYAKDSSSNTCVQCHASCSQCTGSSTQCSVCNAEYFKQPAPDDTTCSSSCPAGYAGDSTTRTCVQCDISCSVCTGTGNTQCSACNLGYFIQPAPAATTCSSSCPVGFWKDIDNRSCAPCNAACAVCTGPDKTQCSECNSGYFLQPSGTGCLDSCPSPGYWQDTTNHVCATCNTACSVCTGSSDTQCSACKSGFFLQPEPDATTCSSSCPLGFWEDTTNHICVPCNVACVLCSDGTHTQCTACSPGYFLQPSPSTVCLNACPDGYWGNSGSNSCDTCNAACAICTGPSDTQCSACNSGYFLQPSSTTCLDSCPIGYWGNTTSNTCMECDIACSNCTNATNTACSACNTGYFLQPSSTTCLSSCPNGSFPNSTGNLCLTCDISCALCSGPANTECSACNPGFFLQPSSTICLETCPPTYYYPITTLHACESISKFNVFIYYSVTLHLGCPINCPNCTGPTCDKLDSETLTTIEAVATAASVAAQASTIATIIIPVIIVTAGSVVALFLDFMGEIALFQYINVPFPVNFEAFMQFFSANIFPNFLAKTYDESESVISSNGKFGEYECSRVFLDNCGGGLDKEFLAIAVIIVTSILAVALKNCPKVHSFVCKIRDSYRWNGLLAFYIGDFQEFFVFTLLQFRESVKPLISLIIGILLVASYFIMYLYISVALNRRKKAAKKVRDSRRQSRTQSRKTQEQEEEIIGDIPESMNMVVEDFVRKYWYSRNFLLLMCLQNAIVGFVLVFLQNWGIIQAGLYSYSAIFYGILVLGAFRPFKEKSQVMAFSVSQIIKGSMGCLALALGLDEKWLLFSDDQKNALGITLITLVCIGIGSNLLLSVGMIVKAILDYYRNFKKRQLEKKTSQTKLDKTAVGESKIKQPSYIESLNNSIGNRTALESEVSTNKFNSRKRSSEKRVPRSRPKHFYSNLPHLQQRPQQGQHARMENNMMEFDFQGIVGPSKHAPRRKNSSPRPLIKRNL